MIHTGRHFLQIPGPTNVPDRVLLTVRRPQRGLGCGSSSHLWNRPLAWAKVHSMNLFDATGERGGAWITAIEVRAGAPCVVV